MLFGGFFLTVLAGGEAGSEHLQSPDQVRCRFLQQQIADLRALFRPFDQFSPEDLVPDETLQYVRNGESGLHRKTLMQ